MCEAEKAGLSVDVHRKPRSLGGNYPPLPRTRLRGTSMNPPQVVVDRRSVAQGRSCPNTSRHLEEVNSPEPWTASVDSVGLDGPRIGRIAVDEGSSSVCAEQSSGSAQHRPGPAQDRIAIYSLGGVRPHSRKHRGASRSPSACRTHHRACETHRDRGSDQRKVRR